MLPPQARSAPAPAAAQLKDPGLATSTSEVLPVTPHSKGTKPRCFQLEPQGSTGCLLRRGVWHFICSSCLKQLLGPTSWQKELSASVPSPEGLTLPCIPELSPRNPDGSLTGFLILGNALNLSRPQLASGRRFNYMVMSLDPAGPSS